MLDRTGVEERFVLPAEPDDIPSAWPFGKKAATVGAMQHCSTWLSERGETRHASGGWRGTSIFAGTKTSELKVLERDLGEAGI